MFSDLRYFFPEEAVYKRLRIFHELDIFEGQHFRIRETYLGRQQARRNTLVERRLSRLRESSSLLQAAS